MLSHVRDRNIWIVYLAVFLLGTAYGVSVALIALHLDARGFGKEEIGRLAAWFAGGIVAMSLPSGAIVRRLSAKVTLAAALLGYAVSVAIFPFLVSYEAIAAARFCDGAFSVCIWVSCETILLQRAERAHKAQVMSLYAMAIAIGYVLGPLAAKAVVAAAPMHTAFATSGAIAAMSSLVVTAALDRDRQGEGDVHGGAPTGSETPGSTLLWQSKTSCFATFAYGYFQASVVLFLPLYLIESKGIAREQTILVPAFFAAGMLLFTNAAGKLGDRYGHLVVMRWLAVLGLGMVLGFVFLERFAAMAVAVFVAGATLASISPVSLALQGVTSAPRDYGRTNAIYNAFYACGILLGPPVSSAIFARWGGALMLVHLAALWGAFVLFTLVYWADDPAARGARAAGSDVDADGREELGEAG